MFLFVPSQAYDLLGMLASFDLYITSTYLCYEGVEGLQTLTELRRNVPVDDGMHGSPEVTSH